MLLHEILDTDDTFKMIKSVISTWPDVQITDSDDRRHRFFVHPKNGDLEAYCSLFILPDGEQQLIYSIVGKGGGGLTGEYSGKWTLEKTLDKLEAWMAKANKPPRKRANTKS